jgi:hypothetical protein
MTASSQKGVRRLGENEITVPNISEKLDSIQTSVCHTAKTNFVTCVGLVGIDRGGVGDTVVWKVFIFRQILYKTGIFILISISNLGSTCEVCSCPVDN